MYQGTEMGRLDPTTHRGPCDVRFDGPMETTSLRFISWLRVQEYFIRHPRFQEFEFIHISDSQEPRPGDIWQIERSQRAVVRAVSEARLAQNEYFEVSFFSDLLDYMAYYGAIPPGAYALGQVGDTGPGEGPIFCLDVEGREDIVGVNVEKTEE